MRKIILFTILSLSFISCEYCPYGHDEDGFDDYGIPHYHQKYDYFCAEKLLGTWQCEYGCIVGSVEFKEIEFLSERTCDITMAQARDVNWYTQTFTYSYYGNTIKFTRNGQTISFVIRGYIFPELYLEDSFGKYTWRKVRAYGC
jgi:hypothetical protein